MTVGTFKFRILAFNGKNGLGHAEIMEVCRQSECDIIGLHETRRDGQYGFTAAGYTVYCSGARGAGTEGKGHHAVGLAVEESILQDVEKDGLAVENASVRLMKVRLNLKRISNGTLFVVAYAPTDSHKAVRDKDPSWVELRR